MASSTKLISRGLAASLLLLTLAACANPTLIKVGLDTWCDTNKPERPTAAQYATFTHEQKVDMADHNEFGRRHCKWTAAG